MTDRGTKLPTRFAEIQLVPVSPGPLHLQKVSGSSGLDGRFRLDGVPTGDYFVAVLKAGCVAIGASTEVDASDDDLQKLFRSLPSVHVTKRNVARVNLTL